MLVRTKNKLITIVGSRLGVQIAAHAQTKNQWHYITCLAPSAICILNIQQQHLPYTHPFYQVTHMYSHSNRLVNNVIKRIRQRTHVIANSQSTRHRALILT